MTDLTRFVTTEDEKFSGDFELLPEGIFKAVILKDEIKETKTGGSMLVITLQVLTKFFVGKELTDRLNFLCIPDNPRDENKAKKARIAEAISRGRMEQIACAVGIEYSKYLKNTSGAFGVPIAVVVGVDKPYEYDGKTYQNNCVKKYLPLSAIDGQDSVVHPTSSPALAHDEIKKTREKRQEPAPAVWTGIPDNDEDIPF